MVVQRFFVFTRLNEFMLICSSFLVLAAICSNEWVVLVAYGGDDPIEEELHDEEECNSQSRCVCRDGVKLVRDGKVIATLSRGDIVESKAEKNGSLLVFFSGLHRQELEGWISPNDVMSAGEAFDFFTKSIEAKPDDARAYLARAVVMRYGMNYWTGNKTILQDLTRAIELAPESALAYVERGGIRECQGENELAEKDFNRAIKLEPNAWVIFLLRGECRLKMKKLSEAVSDFDKALSMKPKDSHLLSLRGQAHLESGHFQNALDDLRQAKKIDKTARVEEQLYEALIGLERFQEVIDISTKKISQNSLPGSNYAWRAKALSALGEFQAAEDDFISAVTRDSGDNWICLSYALFLAACPESDFRNGANACVLARRACYNAMRETGDGYDIVGSVKESSNNRPQFNIKWIRKGWTNWQCLDTLAAVYAEKGEFGKAVECQKLAIRFAPKEREAQLQSRLKLYQCDKPYRFKIFKNSNGKWKLKHEVSFNPEEEKVSGPVS